MYFLNIKLSEYDQKPNQAIKNGELDYGNEIVCLRFCYFCFRGDAFSSQILLKDILYTVGIPFFYDFIDKKENVKR